MDHPKLHDEATLCVERQKQYGRVRYSASNQLALKFAEGLEQKTFTKEDLKWIKSLGYSILIVGHETEEFE